MNRTLAFMSVTLLACAGAGCNHWFAANDEIPIRAQLDRLEAALLRDDEPTLRLLSTGKGWDSIVFARMFWGVSGDGNTIAPVSKSQLLMGEYLQKHEPSKIVDLGDNYMRVEFEGSQPGSISLLFRKIHNEYKLDCWCNERSILKPSQLNDN